MRRPEYRPWDPEEAAVTTYPICDYQPVYFVAER
jgi:phenylalanine-4-hydroxylase